MTKKSEENKAVLIGIGIREDQLGKAMHHLPSGITVVSMYSKTYRDSKGLPRNWFFGLSQKWLEVENLERFFALFVLGSKDMVLVIPGRYLLDLFGSTKVSTGKQWKLNFYKNGDIIELAVPDKSGREDVSKYLNKYDLLGATLDPTDYQITHRDSDMEQETPDTELPEVKEDTHLRIQYLLVKIGVMEGQDVWTAKNDKNKEYNDEKLADICLDELPHFAPQGVLKIAELIDVIWFKKNTAQPVCFFEIEHTTTIYSGLLRLNDVKIDHRIAEAYIIADEKRRKLFEDQISRRTFAYNQLNEICQFMNYEDIEEWYKGLRRAQKVRGRR